MPFQPQYSHDLDTSVALWLDNRLCDKGQAYINVTGNLYPQVDPSTPGYIWAAPWKSWVFDSCVAGATVCSGVYTSSGQFLTPNSGIVIDYIHGRVISPYNWGAGLSGVYSRKQINVYFSTEEQTDFFLEQVFQEDVNVQYFATGGYVGGFAAPCVILTNSRGNNEGFALGGLKQTNNVIRGFIISDSNYLQEGINSLLTDTAETYIPFCSYADAPIGTSGNLKGVNYNYCTGIRDKYGCNKLYIEDAYSFKINERANSNVSYMLSIIELDVNMVRMAN